VFGSGIPVPFFLRWWGLRQPPRPVKELTAHIDVFPSLLDACGVAPPKGVKIDGRSFVPLLREAAAPWPERELFFQWHRGDVPEKGRACAARDSRWKAVWTTPKDKAMLFDLQADPAEKSDVALENSDVVDRLTRNYEDLVRGHAQDARLRAAAHRARSRPRESRLAHAARTGAARRPAGRRTAAASGWWTSAKRRSTT
jgi:arylsulfatase/arylsulfatase A